MTPATGARQGGVQHKAHSQCRTCWLNVNHPGPQVFNKYLLGDSDISIALEVDGSTHIPRAKLGDLLKVGGLHLLPSGGWAGDGVGPRMQGEEGVWVGETMREDAQARLRPSATSLHPITQAGYPRMQPYARVVVKGFGVYLWLTSLQAARLVSACTTRSCTAACCVCCTPAIPTRKGKRAGCFPATSATVHRLVHVPMFAAACAPSLLCAGPAGPAAPQVRAGLLVHAPGLRPLGGHGDRGILQGGARGEVGLLGGARLQWAAVVRV